MVLRGAPSRFVSLIVGLSCLVTLLPAITADCSAEAATSRYIVPSSGRIFREFVEPPSPYAAGHRGIDFRVSSGSRVVASNVGVVTFAGPVALDGLFVSIRHTGGIVTSYSFMSRVDVVVGQRVARGQLLGLSGAGHPGAGHPGARVESLHFGVRYYGRYIDPMLLLFGNLDDISDMIALAPVAQQESGTLMEGSSSSSMRPVSYLRVRGIGGVAGLRARLGEAIAGMFSSFGHASSRLVSWFKAVVGGVGGWLARGGRAAVSLAMRVARAADGFLARAGSFFSAVVRGGRAVGGWLARGGRAAVGLAMRVARAADGFLARAGSFFSAVVRGGRAVGGWLARGGRAAVGLVGRLAALVGRVASRVPVLGRAVALAGRAVGAMFRMGMRVGGWLASKVGGAISAGARGLWRLAMWIRAAWSWLIRGLLGGWSGAARFISGFLIGRARTALHNLLHGGLRVQMARLIAGAVAGITVGLFKQVACSIRGGVKPPRIPSVSQFRSGASAPPPPNNNIVVAIAGIGSSSHVVDGEVVGESSMYQMDLRTLGFREDQIFHYSYRGVEDRGGRGPYRLHAPYTKEDTYQDIAISARRLGRQLKVIQRRYPERSIDLVAHSQGGLVAEYYLEKVYDPSEQTGPKVGHLVTLSTPHTGADLAGIHESLSGSVTGRAVLQDLNKVARTLSLPPPSATSTRQMADNSGFIKDLTVGWDPRKVKTTTIATPFDYVVAPQHTRLRGSETFTVNVPVTGSLDAHSAIVTSSTAKGYIYNALGNRRSECTALRNAIADHGTGRAISTVEKMIVSGGSIR